MSAIRHTRLVYFTSESYIDHVIPLANELCNRSDFLLIVSCFCNVSEQRNSCRPKQFLGSGVRTHYSYRRQRRRNPLQLIYDVGLFARIAHFAPEVLLIEGVESPFFLIFYPLIKLLRVRMVFLLNDAKPHSGNEKPLLDLLTSLALRLCDRIVVFSDDQQSECKAVLNREASVIHLVYPTHYETYYQHHSIQRERWTILFFGTVRQNKGLEILIQAAEIARRSIPGLRVIIAGKCSDFTYYRNYVETPTMFELHLKWIPDQDVGRYFLRSQCSILPYHDATQSGPLLISLAFNCPVIAADVGGLPEYLSEGRNGLLFTKNSCSGLADKIVQLLTDESTLRSMQANSRPLLINRFSPPAVANELLNVLESP